MPSSALRLLFPMLALNVSFSSYLSLFMWRKPSSFLGFLYWTKSDFCNYPSAFLLLFLCRSVPIKKRIDGSENLTLDHIRHSLIRQEDSIIYNLLERAQYCYNEDTYDPDAFSVDGFHGSLVEYMVRETEKLHAKVWTLTWKGNNWMKIFYNKEKDKVEVLSPCYI